MSRRAVFVDRDGTFVDDPGYLRDPAAVRLLPGSSDALAALARAGYELVVITNQSGVGRGLLSPGELDLVNAEIERQLALPEGAALHWYVCPHHPDDRCGCRKPGTMLHRRAIADLGIDLPGSWCIGDRMADLLPARELGIGGILVLTGEGGSHAERARAAGFLVRGGLPEAVETVLSG